MFIRFMTKTRNILRRQLFFIGAEMEFCKVNELMSVCLKCLTKLARNQLLMHMEKLLELFTLAQNIYSVTFRLKPSVDVTEKQINRRHETLWREIWLTGEHYDKLMLAALWVIILAGIHVVLIYLKRQTCLKCCDGQSLQTNFCTHWDFSNFWCLVCALANSVYAHDRCWLDELFSDETTERISCFTYRSWLAAYVE